MHNFLSTYPNLTTLILCLWKGFLFNSQNDLVSEFIPYIQVQFQDTVSKKRMLQYFNTDANILKWNKE